MHPIVELFLLGLPIASVSWTLTHEEIFREPREWCSRKSRTCAHLVQRKFFYALTCEYCLSHYVTAAFLALTRFQLILTGWRGYLLALFALVWIANLYMGLFGRLRLDIKHERVEIEADERKIGKRRDGAT
jgi:hypothetical protein